MYHNEILAIVDQIEDLIKNNNRRIKDKFGLNFFNTFSEETIQELKLGADVLRVAHIYAVRASHLAKDRDETDFHSRLRQELSEYEN